jgi:hypothetical protein
MKWKASMKMAATWMEVNSSTAAASTTAPSVEQSLNLLQATFPTRYTSHSPTTIRSKMGKTRKHPSGNSITSLRIWSHFDSGTVDITVFFFLRLRFCPECYVMTVGTSLTDDQTLYNEISTIPVPQMKTDPQVPKIEILNVNRLPDDITAAGNTDGAKALGRAFQLGITATTITPNPNPYHLGPPWASTTTSFMRWHC